MGAKVKKILDDYGSEAGQELNTRKSTIIFSAATDHRTTRDIKSALRITTVSSSFTYLGETVGIKLAGSKEAATLRDRIQKRIQLWRGQALSLARRRTLLRAVLTAIPLYWMGFKLMAKKDKKSIIPAQLNFLWRGSTDRTLWTTVAWKTITKPVMDGGLGIRDITVKT